MTPINYLTVAPVGCAERQTATVFDIWSFNDHSIVRGT
jgi:hypothetical protein